MSSEWPTFTLGDLCSKITDGAHNSPKTAAAGKAMASVKDLTRFGVDLSQARLIPIDDFNALVKQGCKPEVGDVLIAKDGNSALDTVCNVDCPLDAVLLSSVAILRPNSENLDSHYLKHYLASPDVIAYLKANFISGAAIPRVVLKDFKKAEIRVPPLRTQRAISVALDSLDDRITLLRETNATLEAIAQALFKSWFVDFDPVRAKQAGRAPEGMGEATAALFPDGFEESELGLVPRGWQAASVGDVCTQIFSGGTPDTRKAEYWDGEIPWFSSGETRNRIVIDSEKRINRRAVENSSTKLASPGDILIASAGQGHTRGQTSYCAIETYINQSVVSVRADRKKCAPVWLFYNLSRRYDEMRNLSDSHSSRGSLTTKLLTGMPVLVPNFPLLQAFADVASALVASQVGNASQAQTLATLRDTLLPRLISGRLRLPEAEAIVEEVS